MKRLKKGVLVVKITEDLFSLFINKKGESLMKAICFSVHDFEKVYLETWAKNLSLEIDFLTVGLTGETVDLARGYDAVICWANDNLSGASLKHLHKNGVKMVSLRSAGFSHLDFEVAKELGLVVGRVPSYSPEAIAEHTFGLLMCLNRHYPRAFQRIKDFNFTLEGLEGVTLKGKTVGVVGAGLIGAAFARIMKGVGCQILLHDPNEDQELARELGASYMGLEELLRQSDIVSLHCPLNYKTRYILNKETISLMKDGVFLLNTGRGALIDTDALIANLKTNKFRGVGLDVYEYEEGVFFKDHSDLGLSDEKLLRLMSFPRVLITSHQAFFTEEALENIAKDSLQNVKDFFEGQELPEGHKVL